MMMSSCCPSVTIALLLLLFLILILLLKGASVCPGLTYLNTKHLHVGLTHKIIFFLFSWDSFLVVVLIYHPFLLILLLKSLLILLSFCFILPTGYGFVDFESPFAAEAAVKALQASGIQAQMAKVCVFFLLHLPLWAPSSLSCSSSHCNHHLIFLAL